MHLSWRGLEIIGKGKWEFGRQGVREGRGRDFQSKIGTVRISFEGNGDGTIGCSQSPSRASFPPEGGCPALDVGIGDGARRVNVTLGNGPVGKG